MIYIAFLSFSFAPDMIELNETAIIDLMAIVAPILPMLLIAAALSAQFRAAVADTGGAGGLVDVLTNQIRHCSSALSDRALKLGVEVVEAVVEEAGIYISRLQRRLGVDGPAALIREGRFEA